ncbi:putative abc bile acid [Phaeomoniella chlamydospora]|uniref:Putative abc bile acid n=1 Tax=Phaeomoniella chlamydospora TaxID=158046 RepID=A0A0G2EGF7_PHACM|nr:putative abc bile acid [Phaeomoniella chlamydospora]
MLISLLFRLLPVKTGTIYINDVDISTVHQETLGQSIISIPQEPFLLSGTGRFNAAPHSASDSFNSDVNTTTHTDINILPPPSDTLIISALTIVGLWSSTSSRGITLSSPISSPRLFHGQEQLFCLARAIILSKQHQKLPKKTASPPISIFLVLDEPTYSTDE